MTIIVATEGRRGGRRGERGRERRGEGEGEGGGGGGIRGCYMASLNRDLEVVKNWNDKGCCFS